MDIVMMKIYGASSPLWNSEKYANKAKEERKMKNIS